MSVKVGKFEWDYKTYEDSTLGLISAKDNPYKSKLVSLIEQQVLTDNEKALFKIKFGDLKHLESTYVSILNYEDFPLINSTNEIQKMRIDFSLLFMDLIALLGNKQREEVTPVINLNRETDSLLLKYFEVLDTTEGTEKWIIELFEELEFTRWQYDNGYCYYIDTNLPIEKQLIELLKGIWSFYWIVNDLTEPMDVVLEIDLPKIFTDLKADKQIKEFTYKILKLAKVITTFNTVSMLLILETMYPLPELHCEKHLYLEYSSQDFDYREKNNQPYFLDEVIEGWYNNKKEMCMGLDCAKNKRFSINL